jgi:putative oxidoreductase
MLKRLLFQPFPPRTDFGLLILRVVAFAPLFLKHGTEKIFRYSQMAQHFPNPLHIGVVPSLTFAMVSDSICSVLLILGLATRWAALITFVNIFVAWAFVHHFVLFGPQGDHGEVIVLYLAAAAALFFAGAGRFSLDRLIAGLIAGRSAAASEERQHVSAD